MDPPHIITDDSIVVDDINKKSNLDKTNIDNNQ